MTTTQNQQIKELLAQVPEDAIPFLIDFLRAVTGKSTIKAEEVKMQSKTTSVAQRTFGTIPADAAVVRQALSEDLYGFE
jgi:hypothetical protein